MDATQFDVFQYCNQLKNQLIDTFGSKICYVGLQGSYLRGEATKDSDVDVVVIFDTLEIDDMKAYREVLKRIGNEDMACGFVCSKQDVANWNCLEICQFLHTTKDVYGTLSQLLPQWKQEDEAQYIKLSLNNLYHALCHTYIHQYDKLENQMVNFYKNAFFILQNMHFFDEYKNFGHEAKFILKKTELLPKLEGDDKRVLQTLIDLSFGAQIDCDKHFKLLFDWCQSSMNKTE